MARRKRVAAAYFVFQALAVAGWWMMLAVAPDTRSWFAPAADWGTLLAFAPGDIGIIAIGSAYAGIRVGEGTGRFVAWVVAGAMLYAAINTITVALARTAPALGALLMTPAAMATIWSAIVLSRNAASPDLPSRAGP